MPSETVSNHPKACLVISHYNAWPEDMLIALLDQVQSIPAGAPFHTRIVVNQAVDKPLVLPDRHAGTEVLYRPNTGYNIGAWDHGWRVEPAFDFYLFLQEECIILQPNWMKGFQDALVLPGVGLVGESMSERKTWERFRQKEYQPLCSFLGFPNNLTDTFFEVAREAGVEPGQDITHLQSLILATRREVLERINGFRTEAKNYTDAVCSEILISKAVATAGWTFRQIGERRFTVILHPQWKEPPRWRMVLNQTTAFLIPADIRRASSLIVGALRARANRLLSRLTST